MHRVLVVRIGRFGDTILATPVIEALQQAYGKSVEIDFATGAGASAYILELDQRINRVFPVAHRSRPWRLHRVKRELEAYSSRNPYDLVVNLECGKECDDFIRFVHHDKFCGRPLLQPQHQAGWHCVDTEKTIYADLLGPGIAELAETGLQLTLEPEKLPLAGSADYVVINPGFSGFQKGGYRSHRGWPQAHWRRFIELLTETAGLSVLINGTTEEQTYFAALLQKPGVFSLFGSSIPELCSALSSAKGLITVDTGTMHLSMALGTPVVALFGPTNPELTGPYSKKVPHSMLSSGVDCQPCVNTPEQKRCTFNRCMSELEPEQVFENCRQVLKT
jgi:ADP-heptose:LPS heptosyltransferase